MNFEAETRDAVAELAEIARRGELVVATAESLTSGNLAACIGKASAASEWYAGGVVAYSKTVKHALLGVPEGSVVSEDAARAMAEATASLMKADLTVAVTGEGGPEPQDAVEPGTVCFGIADRGEAFTETRHFAGEPEDVVRQTTQHAVYLLVTHARKARS